MAQTITRNGKEYRFPDDHPLYPGIKIKYDANSPFDPEVHYDKWNKMRFFHQTYDVGQTIHEASLLKENYLISGNPDLDGFKDFLIAEGVKENSTLWDEAIHSWNKTATYAEASTKVTQQATTESLNAFKTKVESLTKEFKPGTEIINDVTPLDMMEYREEKVNEASSENLEWYNTELMNAENKFMALHENEIKQMLEPHLEEINTTLEAEFGDQIDIIETEIENLKSSWNIEDEAKQEELVSNAVDVVNNMIKNILITIIYI